MVGLLILTFFHLTLSVDRSPRLATLNRFALKYNSTPAVAGGNLITLADISLRSENVQLLAFADFFGLSVALLAVRPRNKRRKEISDRSRVLDGRVSLAGLWQVRYLARSFSASRLRVVQGCVFLLF